MNLLVLSNPFSPLFYVINTHVLLILTHPIHSIKINRKNTKEEDLVTSLYSDLIDLCHPNSFFFF